MNFRTLILIIFIIITLMGIIYLERNTSAESFCKERNWTTGYYERGAVWCEDYNFQYEGSWVTTMRFEVEK